MFPATAVIPLTTSNIVSVIQSTNYSVASFLRCPFIVFKMKRQAAWNKLEDEMGNKRNRNDRKISKKRSAQHKFIVERLASEPDNKQTYKPIRPRLDCASL